MIVDDAGARMFVCSDSDYCQEPARTHRRMHESLDTRTPSAHRPRTHQAL